MISTRPKSKTRGFAGMSIEKRKAIASKGGTDAHVKGTAHQFTSEEARRAGQKGGAAVARNKEHMREIGKKGAAGKALWQNAKKAALGEKNPLLTGRIGSVGPLAIKVVDGDELLGGEE